MDHEIQALFWFAALQSSWSGWFAPAKLLQAGRRDWKESQ